MGCDRLPGIEPGFAREWFEIGHRLSPPAERAPPPRASHGRPPRGPRQQASWDMIGNPAVLPGAPCRTGSPDRAPWPIDLRRSARTYSGQTHSSVGMPTKSTTISSGAPTRQ
jgi:hypothetical protein